jgi:hypothetical protein
MNKEVKRVGFSVAYFIGLASLKELKIFRLGNYKVPPRRSEKITLTLTGFNTLNGATGL